jgi:hypothetical protein
LLVCQAVVVNFFSIAIPLFRIPFIPIPLLSVGSFAEDEACSWVKSTVLQWRDDDAGVLELVRYVGCLPLALGLASAHARVHGTRSPTEFLAAKRAVQPPQLEVGAKVELLEYDAEAQRWAVELGGQLLENRRYL